MSWTHFIYIIPLDDPLKRDFYAEMCRVERWSVRTLQKKIGGMLFERTALSKKPAELARQELAALRDEDQLTPDLVFLDLGMPGIDGFETARRLRALPGGRDIVIAALTGWGLAADRQRTREAGFDLHIVKPVDDAALVHAFDQVKSAAAAHRRH